MLGRREVMVDRVATAVQAEGVQVREGMEVLVMRPAAISPAPERQGKETAAEMDMMKERIKVVVEAADTHRPGRQALRTGAAMAAKVSLVPFPGLLRAIAAVEREQGPEG